MLEGTVNAMWQWMMDHTDSVIEASVAPETFDRLDIARGYATGKPLVVTFDFLSWWMQRWSKNIGLNLPDIRYRYIMEPEADKSIARHFGTLEGAKDVARKIIEARGRD